MSEQDTSMPNQLHITMESMSRGASKENAADHLLAFRWLVEEKILAQAAETHSRRWKERAAAAAEESSGS